MSTPPTITSVSFSQAAYAPGTQMVATVAVTTGTVDDSLTWSGVGAGPDGQPGNWAFTFTTEASDPVTLAVTDSAGGVWSRTGSDDPRSTTWTASAPAGALGSLTVAATATGTGSGLSGSYTADTLITQPLVGTNKGAWATLQPLTGPMQAYRGYVPPSVGVPSSWPGNGAAPIPPGKILPIVSLNLDVNKVLSGEWDYQLATYARTVPAGALISVGAEDEAGRFGWTPIQVRTLQAKCYQVLKRANPGLLYGQCVTTYTSYPASAHYPLATATDPKWIQAGLDWYGLDAYPVSSTDTAEANIGGAIKQMRLAGVGGPWVIAETNTHYGNRSAWFQQVYKYARQIGALAVCSFWGGDPYAWDSGDTAAITTLKQITAQSAQT